MTGFLSLFENETNKKKGLLLLFLIVYHLTLFYSLSHEPVLLRDSEEYINSCKSFNTNGNFYAGSQNSETDYRLYSKRTPIYPLILSGFYSLNLHWNFVYVLQLFLGLFNIFLGLLLIKQLVGEKVSGYFLFSLFILFTPSQFIYSQLIMADLWLQTFIMICLLSFALFIKTKNSIWLISLIVFSTLAALTKPVFLFASFAVAGICLYYFIRQKSQKLLALLVLIPFLSWYSISSQNQKLTGVFHYSSIGYINLLHYNTNLYLNKAIGKSETDKLLEPLMIVPHTKKEFIENYNKVNSVCKKAISSHLLGYSLFHAKGMVYFFLDPGRFDLYNFFRIEEQESNGFLHKSANQIKIKEMLNEHPFVAVSLFVIFLINILKTIGFIGFVWVQRKNKLVWAGAALVFYIAFLTGPLGASRFALPVELILICFASLFFAQGLKKIKSTTIQNH